MFIYGNVYSYVLPYMYIHIHICVLHPQSIHDLDTRNCVPIGKSSKNIKIRIFPFKVNKNTGIVRVLYSYYGPPPLVNFAFEIPAQNSRGGMALVVRIYILTWS